MIDASSVEDLQLLANKIQNLHKNRLPCVNAVVIYHGLMKTAWLPQLMFNIIKKLFGMKGLVELFRSLEEQESTRESMVELREQTIQHMLSGKDTSSPNSAGGFSQKEIDILIKEFRNLTGVDILI